MKKEYVTPATQEQSMTMCQLMAGSPNSIGINDELLNGSNSEGIIFGN